MIISKKQLTLVLSLSLMSAAQAGFQEATGMVVGGTTEATEGVLAMVARGADYLLGPVACILAGQAISNLFVNKHLPHAPQLVNTVEKHLPGGSAVRHTITYLLLGGALYKLVQGLVNSDFTGEFMQANMPQLSGLIDYIQISQATDSQSGCSSSSSSVSSIN